MTYEDLAAGGMFSFGQEITLEKLKDLIRKLELDGKEVPQEIKDFCCYEG